MTEFSFIAPAHAAETTATVAPAGAPATTASAADSIMQFLPMFAILAVMYLLLIRPQQAKFRKHQELLKSLRRGDKIVTGGGILGSIVKLEGEDVLVVEIADNVRVKVQRTSVTEVVARTEPVANSNEPGQKSA